MFYVLFVKIKKLNARIYIEIIINTIIQNEGPSLFTLPKLKNTCGSEGPNQMQ